MSWEIRVQHDGLNAFRVVRGTTKEDAELKAKLQLAAWNERWVSKQEIQHAKELKTRKAQEFLNNKIEAARRAQELQQQIDGLSEILKIGLSQPIFKWERLKDKTQFAIPDPDKPPRYKYSAEPNPAVYAPTITGLDRLLVRRRKRKEAEAETELEAARSRWRSDCEIVDHKNQQAEAEYQKQLKDWKEQRAEHKVSQSKQHAEIDQLEAQYRTSDASAVEFFCLEALSHSPYSQTFPQKCTMSFDSASGVLILDYDLPNKADLPNLKEVKYIATRNQIQEVPTSDAWLNRTYDEVLYQIALRSLHELFSADTSAVLKSIVFNGWVHSIDRATGAETYGCILSLQANRDEFLEINLSQVDPKACFRRLKGSGQQQIVRAYPRSANCNVEQGGPSICRRIFRR